MLSVRAAIAGTTCGFQVRVRTYSDSVPRGSAGTAAVEYLASDWEVVVATAIKGAICWVGMARFRAYAIGTVPMRISMMRPMPFWPSFEPWAKDTPPQVRMRRPRIHPGGAALPLGSWYRAWLRTSAFKTNSSSAAKTKPITGESSSDQPIFAAWPQSTPLVPSRPCIKALATPTPMIEPIMVWEEEAGSPSHQVPRFHMMAAIKSANTMAKPALEP